jgi:hypothetical protein
MRSAARQEEGIFGILTCRSRRRGPTETSALKRAWKEINNLLRRLPAFDTIDSAR